ncbi:hypothetical protein OF83DRAFT_1173462 [Amylostereum chailletii]|nr:hypothetical protein OF83DRAFT_1173462 [Amylostereum chailletii]
MSAAEDPAILRELCRYQIQELTTLKERLEKCKCEGVDIGESSVQKEPRRLEKQTSQLKENNELKATLAEKDEELERLKLIVKNFGEDVKPNIVTQRTVTPVPPSAGPEPRKEEDHAEHLVGVNWEEKYESLKIKHKFLKSCHEEAKATSTVFALKHDKAMTLINNLETEHAEYRREPQQRVNEFLKRDVTDTFPSVEQCDVFSQTNPGKKFMDGSVAPKASLPVTAVILESAEILHCSTGISRILLLQLSRRFVGVDPHAGFDSFWQSTVPRFSVDQVCDIIHHSDTGYSYMGTYRCAASHALSDLQAQQLDGFVADIHGARLKEDLVSLPELIPPHTTKAIQTLFGTGAVGALALALERVDFNKGFKNALNQHSSHPNNPPSKRKRSQEDQEEGTTAKRCHSQSGLSES